MRRLGLMAGLWAGLAAADGIPTTQPLVYSGVLLNSVGAPVTTAQTAVLSLWDDATSTANANKKCEGATVNLAPDARGAFQVVLDPTCLDVVRTTPNVWVQLQVSNSILPRTKLGAVPYAVEAARASEAGGSLDTRLRQLMPPKTVVNVALTASEVTLYFDSTGRAPPTSPYAGWALCNGSNGTPNLAGRFVRVSTSGSGATGGADAVSHTHAIDHDHGPFSTDSQGGHTHSTPNHQHLIPIGWDNSTIYFHNDSANGPLYGSAPFSGALRFSLPTAGFGGSTVRQAYTDNNSGAATTGAAGGHSHSVDAPALTGTSGGASNTENRPAFTELVAIMRL